jgi:hypothetical protein
MFSSVEEYIDALRWRDFLCVIRGGGVIQVDYLVEGTTVVEHRLAYLPCPFEFSDEELAGAPILDVIETLSEREYAARFRCRGPLRMDFRVPAPPAHPTSHLHLLVDQCRIPVFGPVSPGLFFRFVFKNFYPEAWIRHPLVRQLRIRWLGRTVTAVERGEVYLDALKMRNVVPSCGCNLGAGANPQSVQIE